MTKDPIESLHSEIEKSVTALSKAKDLNERKVISETIKNLIESMEAIANLAEAMGPLTDMDEEFHDFLESRKP